MVNIQRWDYVAITAKTSRVKLEKNLMWWHGYWTCWASERIDNKSVKLFFRRPV